MGVAFYIATEEAVDDLDTFVSGKAVAHADATLKGICSELGVKPLMDFCSTVGWADEGEPQHLGGSSSYECASCLSLTYGPTKQSLVARNISNREPVFKHENSLALSQKLPLFRRIQH